MQKYDCGAAHIFTRTEKWEFGETLFTVEMLRVLSCINGERTLGEIAEDLDLSLLDIGNIVKQLDELNIIIMAEEKTLHHVIIVSKNTDYSQTEKPPF